MLYCKSCKKNVESAEHDGSIWCTQCGSQLQKQVFVSESPKPKDSVGGSGNYGEEQNPDEQETGQ